MIYLKIIKSFLLCFIWINIIYKFDIDWYNWIKKILKIKKKNVISRIGTINRSKKLNWKKEKKMEKVKNLSIFFFPFMELIDRGFLPWYPFINHTVVKRTTWWHETTRRTDIENRRSPISRKCGLVTGWGWPLCLVECTFV